MRKASLGTIFLTVFLDLLGFGMVIPFLPGVARHLGASDFVASLNGSVYSLMQFLLVPVWGRLSDRVGRRPVIVAGWALYAVTYLAFGWATSAWQTWALFVLYGLYYALAEGPQRAIVADLVPAGARGTAFGWYNAVVGLVALPASLGFGKLADR
ncbi:MAG TPA: MFS transporter, partial [Polyangia bacterium]|nr:MFS transporter [Polyangia bacterium]